jgi:hypothetical protein
VLRIACWHGLYYHQHLPTHTSYSHLRTTSCSSLLQPQEETAAAAAEAPSTSSSGYQRRMTTEQWRQQYESDGTVDLFLNDDFNAGAKLIVSAAWSSSSIFV